VGAPPVVKRVDISPVAGPMGGCSLFPSHRARVTGWDTMGAPVRGPTGDLAMRRRPLAYSLAALLLTSFGLASAQNAFTSRPMNVRAGPNRDYPLVAQLDQGAPLDVQGCLNDWSWCDVSFDGNRGWIYAGGISFVYQGERVPLYSYGPSLGLPIVTFSLMTYWDTYYRGRPWYAQRTTWAHRRMPAHLRPAGRPHAGPPPMPQGRPGRPAAGGRPQTHAAPQSMSRGRPAAGGRPQPRGAQRGHAAPGGRGAQKRPPSGHPPLGS
jgi:uncharacterized protein YraI